MTSQPFHSLTAHALPLVRDNIDTDAIIPSREMKSVSKKGLADGLFAGWRYTEVGGREPDPAFVMNRPEYRDATILIGGTNFGCGSSREHAAWALAEYGFRAIVAPSFNPIFRGNCVRNGIVPVELPAEAVAALAEAAERLEVVTVDLATQIVSLADGRNWAFAIEREAKEMLFEGLDAIELTFKRADQIAAFRARDRAARPWVYL
ncbi:3-isopropylmalate dehydratase small subunit [Flavisphingomonas formosensis]|uniref:3-isopropylmalate dehydratase small subunit n=1 Tax=Flavisphingomonas formosensis TaxID=861534 RepID=UPI0012FB664F|nr:3-isopropylmalate dehydratase small subunit [Sphingomonas formosensis]